MIEIVYKEEKQEPNGNEGYFTLPKNIRQIGECKGKQKIYIEDYAYTYLRRMAEEAKGGCAAILFGRYNWSDGNAYLFVRSAMQIHTMEPAADYLKFDDAVWGEVHEVMEKYFPGQAILGWALSLPEYREETNERILKTHLNHFGGNDKTFLRLDAAEKEETFFLYEGNALVGADGFYVYYEKNEPMQNYMVDQNQNRSVENTNNVNDRAVTDFRRIVEEKKETREPEGKKTGYYAIAACAAAALIFTAVHKYADIDFLSFANSRGTAAVTASSGSEVKKETADIGKKENGEYESEREQQTEQQTEQRTEEPGDAGVEGIGVSDGETDTNTIPDGQEMQTAGNTVQMEMTDPVSDSAGGEDAAVSAQVWQEYTVQKGDTLSKISEQYYGTMGRVKDICELNGIASEDLILAGQKILLPK